MAVKGSGLLSTTTLATAVYCLGSTRLSTMARASTPPNT